MRLTIGDDDPRLPDNRSYCRVLRGVADRQGLAVGQQLKLRSGSESAVYTIDGLHDTEETVRLNRDGRTLVSATPGDTAVVDGTVPAADYRDAWEQGDITETIWRDPSPKAAVLAPHGGDIEYGTDDTASRIHKRSDVPTHTWMVHGWNPDAYQRYHISSNRLSPHSYPGLRGLVDRAPFPVAVSLHIHIADYVAVGGGADRDVRVSLGDRIDQCLPDTRDVVVDHDRMKYAGTEDSNVVNRLSPQGIQIELTPEDTYVHREAVAKAVVEWLDRNL
ncbi:poly-gamma-glutamate hydrolase family protein [Halobium palmae]|uniref:Poly-gamma-glutamate hydrolase family protein n=1 Tax=Halobium palmae TaxID=1776492 RepID=A0ABD5RX33_9EURY